MKGSIVFLIFALALAGQKGEVYELDLTGPNAVRLTDLTFAEGGVAGGVEENCRYPFDC